MNGHVKHGMRPILAFLLVAVLAASASTGRSDEEHELRARVSRHSQALIRQDFKQAFSLLTSPAQDRAQGLEQFSKAMRKYGVVVQRYSILSVKIDGGVAIVRVRWTARDPASPLSDDADYDQKWVKERGLWRLEDGKRVPM
jgi:hypothetical protein